jgi:hypothetical protein
LHFGWRARWQRCTPSTASWLQRAEAPFPLPSVGPPSPGNGRSRHLAPQIEDARPESIPPRTLLQYTPSRLPISRRGLPGAGSLGLPPRSPARRAPFPRILQTRHQPRTQRVVKGPRSIQPRHSLTPWHPVLASARILPILTRSCQRTKRRPLSPRRTSISSFHPSSCCPLRMPQ